MEKNYNIITKNIISIYYYIYYNFTKKNVFQDEYKIIGSETEFRNGLWIGPLRKMDM